MNLRCKRTSSRNSIGCEADNLVSRNLKREPIAAESRSRDFSHNCRRPMLFLQLKAATFERFRVAFRRRGV
jgi:hypothetical protein